MTPILDIPLYKLNNTLIKNLFRDIGHRLPSETTCKQTAMQLSEDELKRIRNAVHDKQIFKEHFVWHAILEYSGGKP